MAKTHTYPDPEVVVEALQGLHEDWPNEANGFRAIDVRNKLSEDTHITWMTVRSVLEELAEQHIVHRSLVGGRIPHYRLIGY